MSRASRYFCCDHDRVNTCPSEQHGSGLNTIELGALLETEFCESCARVKARGYRSGYREGLRFAEQLVADLLRAGYSRAHEIQSRLEHVAYNQEHQIQKLTGEWPNRDIKPGPIEREAQVRKRFIDSLLYRMCQQCHADSVPLEIHHIVPVRQGGLTVMENLQMLCVPCHLDAHGKRTRKRRAPRKKAAP